MEIENTKTEIEIAKEVIQKQNQLDIDNCVEELKALQEKENEILKKYNCAKNVRGEFINDRIETKFIITKLPE